MKPIIIIQARTGSTRLSNKMVLPFFDNQSVLEILIERLKSIDKNSIAGIVVATSDNPNDDAIESLCKKHNVSVFRGSENDVLQRFIDTAEKYDADNIIRVCADNVFLDTSALCTLACILEANDYDYVSYQTKEEVPSILTHFGFLAEGVKLSALKDVAEKTKNPVFHEHVTNRIHSAQDLYRVKLFPIEDVIPGLEDHENLRLTLDTIDDFEIQKAIYLDLINRNSSLSPKEIMEYLDNEHPEYYKTMKKTINANKK